MTTMTAQRPSLHLPDAARDPGSAALLGRYLAFLQTPHAVSRTDRTGTTTEAMVPRGGAKVRSALERAWAGHVQTLGQINRLRTAPLERVWVWSDLHLCHDKILVYTSRTDRDVSAMGHRLLLAAQERIGPEDWLVFGGDLGFGGPQAMASWLAECPGQKVLILGNHDIKAKRGSHGHQAWIDAGFQVVSPAIAWSLYQPISDARGMAWRHLALTHYPMLDDTLDKQEINLHGHIHDHRHEGRQVNLCVEHLDMAPERLVDRIARWSPSHDLPRTR